MSRQNSSTPTLAQRFWRRVGPGASMFFATLLALPVNAGITLPTDPLSTGARVPPNVLFILDDSGSMAFDYMPDSVPATSNINVAARAYTRNTVFYNPMNLKAEDNYAPWTTASGAPMTGGTSYGSVFASFNFASGTTINLADPASCARYDYNGNGVDGNSNDTLVCGGPQTFYVPKDTSYTATQLADGRNYYRYQIMDASTIKRSEYTTLTQETTVNTPTGFPRTGQNRTSSGYAATYTFDLPEHVYALTVTTTGGSFTRNGADIYLRRGAEPDIDNYDRRAATSANAETLTWDYAPAGSYQVRLYADRSGNNNSTFSNVTLRVTYRLSNACGSGDTGTSGGWTGCVDALPNPSVRNSVSAEIANYATWFSYHRTRMKAAKAGASAAFSGITADMRVGYRTIWGAARDPANPAANSPTYAVPIPVNHNFGLFLDTPDANNRTRWYNRLFATYGNDGTPLHGALQKAGDYFSSDAANGPYGPGTGNDQLACRKNFTILTTDGYWNSASNYTTGTGNADGTAGATITQGTQSYQYTPAVPFTDGYSTSYLGQAANASQIDATLADVAMKYWKTDLRPGMSNIVPSSPNNPAFWQHMVTFGIAIGLSGTVDQKSVAAVMSSTTGATVNGVAGWPQPRGDGNTTIDDLLHAAVNGRGNFVAAGNPKLFKEGLSAALAQISTEVGSFSNIAANSASLSNNSRLFQAKYQAGYWTGEILSYTKRANESGFNTTASWTASAGIPTTNRKVLTSSGGIGADFPTEAQITALDRNGTNDEYKATGAQNAAYIKGDRSREVQHQGNLRDRVHLLGDIVSSSPAYAPNTDTLYVGANDGMLHAINAATGAERFAFIPAGISLSDLSTISRPDYSHRFFVDGPIIVSNRTQTPGNNILVGALGKGGKGLFALNVNDPDAVTATNILRWQRFESNQNNMGLVQSRPLIVKLNNGTTGLIVPNGINSTNGMAVLLVLSLSDGSVIAELNTNAGDPAQDSPSSNGLTGAVGWDRDGNGTTDYVYGGDMLGNMWKFDISSATTSNWGVGNSGAPIFVALGPDGTTRQAITASPTVALHPTTYKTWVFFGTGRFMTNGDVASRTVQTMYAVVDSGPAATKADMTQRSIIYVNNEDAAEATQRAFQQNSPLATGSRGWYINLIDPSPAVASGERVVTSPQLDGTVLEFSTIIPTSTACQTDGRGYLNALDAFSGTSTTVPYFDVNGDGVFDHRDQAALGGGATAPVGSVDPGVGMVTQGSLFSGDGTAAGGGQVCAAGSGGTMGCLGKNEVRNVGRVSWREAIRN
ncbi:PilC/PilY family type IV pilus protein [Pseudoxanthomonas indica]|uniref:Type IV pilus assembly protein PilY1 n=1 Tax=Pseudoxanthomonas indica TaxID=428993 RepID=A0A1T5JH16_9GAMM|nr:PilC/PilY family type IV pilus protein [Pseudoxanthomonas indica]GGD58676.1 hypothetical protein GCM10007235_33740 [Pseudoxanthomonas indica]SKC50664.1 type IV pilus assembly protein PilY1 [Pseudoxanthomonas indica]